MRNHEQAPSTGYSQAVAVIPNFQKTYTEPLSLSDTRLTHHHPQSASYMVIRLSVYRYISYYGRDGLSTRTALAHASVRDSGLSP